MAGLMAVSEAEGFLALLGIYPEPVACTELVEVKDTSHALCGPRQTLRALTLSRSLYWLLAR